MASPVPPQSSPTPTLNQTHTWIYLAGVTLSGVFSAFAPKIQAYASAHPTGTLIVGSALGAIGTIFPSVFGQKPQ